MLCLRACWQTNNRAFLVRSDPHAITFECPVELGRRKHFRPPQEPPIFQSLATLEVPWNREAEQEDDNASGLNQRRSVAGKKAVPSKDRRLKPSLNRRIGELSLGTTEEACETLGGRGWR